jgi:dipeptidyl aminopeptidase/acylaminoacyl peptidase
VSPPLLIKIHGGPTSQFEADYDSDTLFYTSRGFAVLALNYRGSSGYGREYRNSIKRKWGLVDVEDVYSASTFMIREKGVDPSRIVLAGGSAGGFAVLLSLTTHPGTYRAGICRYAVSDLLTLNDETHKFESHYLEFLVGRLPEDETVFRNRSPLLQADRIQDPIALFQGSADKVVPQSQSDAIVDSLREHGVPHIYKVYPGEGHGFRKHETLIDYYETVSQFLQTHVFSKASE